MKRTRILCLACAAALALTTAAAGSALAKTSEPIAVGGSSDGCPTTWHYTYGQDRFYSGNLKVSISGSKGICVDVSEHNGKVKWKELKADGIEYAIIRCGYGQDYESQDDDQWLRNAKYAKKYGIKIGVYLYSYADNEVKAYGEAKHVIRCLKEAGLEPDDVELPVYYDLEEESCRPSNKMLARMTAVWCNALYKEGFKVGVYAGAYWYMSYLTNDVFGTSGLSKWVANYNSACTYCRDDSGKVVAMKNYGDYLDIWQFTSRGWSNGTVNGINRVDTNIIFADSFKTLSKKLSIPGNQISYDLNGGTNNAANPKKFSSSSQTITLSKPTKSGYTFKGWYANGTKVTTISASDYPAVTLVAKWKANKYKIDYKLDGGTNNAKNVTSYKVSKGAFALKDPTKSGYTFKGWYTSKDFAASSKVTSVAGKKNQTIAVYAKWKAKSYKLAYQLSKGSMPASYAASYKTTKRVALPLPTRSGYAFMGWYTDKACTGTPTFVIAKGATGKKTFYGKWSDKYQNAVVVADSVTARADTSDSATAKATFKKGDALCISKKSDDGTWGKVYKVGWVKLADVNITATAGA